MKKTVAFLLLILAFSGVSFASFHVEKKSQVSTSSSVVINKNSVVSDKNVSGNVADSKTNVVSKSQAPISKGKDGGNDKTIAIVLALVSVIFLPFGLHNWYLGRKKQALWQTLLVFPGIILLLPALISWIWQFIDLILLLVNGKL